MKRKLVKTAAGTVLHDSSPASIEELLVNEISDALGQWQNAVKIKPYLRIDETDADLSNNVKNAFGAIELDVYGAKLYIPFIIADKTLLPFDTIRMGEQEISYDYAKLRRVVNAIEHKAKRKEENGEDGDSFETMEVAKFDDVPYNNGFLGTIMEIRDSHRLKDVNSNYPYWGPGFGLVDAERVANNVDVLNEFHEVMEKIANVKVYTSSQIEEFENYLREKIEQETHEEFTKMAAPEETMDEARVKRDMIKLQEERLFNVHRAASGNNIAFPTFKDGQFQYRMGRVYRNFDTLIKKADDYVSGKIGALILDSKAGYCFLNRNEPFMASTNEPSGFELPTELARGLKVGYMYTFEKNETTLYNPFTVERSYVQSMLDDGIVISVRELASNQANINSRMMNSLFEDVFECKEAMPGKSNGSNFNSSWRKPFSIVVTKDANFNQPVLMDDDQMHTYITQHAKDPVDSNLAKNMLMYSDNYVLLPRDYPLFKMEKAITHFYTRPDGLFKEGPLAKTAAYEDRSKATLFLKNQRQPSKYALEWTFTLKQDASPGVSATKLEKRYMDDLSQEDAKKMLDNLGFDHRTQARFFEIAHRNGRSATFKIQNPELAAKAGITDSATAKVKEKMKGLANSMLNSRNFMPAFEDAIAGPLAAVIGTQIPGAVNVAQSVDSFFNTAHSKDVAMEIEKLASEFNGPEWYELSALTNLKYRIDKLASEIQQGNYLYNASPVFEKVASLKPIIEDKSKDLIEFNRKQLLKTSSYLVQPSLIKKAIQQLDGLYSYANMWQSKEKSNQQLSKEAGIFKEPDSVIQISKQINKLKKKLEKSTTRYDKANAKLRTSIPKGSDNESYRKAIKQVEDAEVMLNNDLETLESLHRQKGELQQGSSNKNIALSSAIGLPSLVGLSYGYESLKNS